MNSLSTQFNHQFFDPSDVDDFGELLATGVIDINYANEELPDAFFKDIFSQITKTSDVVVLHEREVINGIESSYLGYVEGERVVLGASKELPDRYLIEPDIGPAIEMLQYGLSMSEKNPIECPVVRVAEPTIPQVALAKPVSVAFLEKEMSQIGAVVLNPSWEAMSDMANHQYISFKSNENLRDQLERKVGASGFVFSARSDLRKWKSVRNCYLEFNPYHPAAIDYIVSLVEDKTLGQVTGKFRWGRSEYDFCYEWQPEAYRVYSDVWGTTLKQMRDMIVFNIRGNFDFAKYFPTWKQRAEQVPFSYMAFTMLQYDMIEAVPLLPYAITASVRVPGPVRMYAKHITKTVSTALAKNQEMFVSCQDVTDKYIMRVTELPPYEVSIVERETGVVIMDIMKGDKKTRVRGESKDLYVEYSLRTNNFRVWLNTEIQVENSRIFIQVKASEGMFYNVPRNAYGCIVSPPDVISLTDYFERRLDLGQQMMATVPMPEEEMREISKDEENPVDVYYKDTFESGYIDEW